MASSQGPANPHVARHPLKKRLLESRVCTPLPARKKRPTSSVVPISRTQTPGFLRRQLHKTGKLSGRATNISARNPAPKPIIRPRTRVMSRYCFLVHPYRTSIPSNHSMAAKKGAREKSRNELDITDAVNGLMIKAYAASRLSMGPMERRQMPKIHAAAIHKNAYCSIHAASWVVPRNRQNTPRIAKRYQCSLTVASGAFVAISSGIRAGSKVVRSPRRNENTSGQAAPALSSRETSPLFNAKRRLGS